MKKNASKSPTETDANVQPMPAASAPKTIKLLTRQDVADAIGVSTESIKRWGKSGKIKEIVFARNVVRYHPDELTRLIAS